MCVCFGKCLGLCRFKMREFPPVCEASILQLSVIRKDEHLHLKMCFSIHMRGDNMSSKSYSCVTVRRIMGLMGGVSCTYCRCYVGI